MPSQDSIQQHPQLEDTSAGTTNLSGDPTVTCAIDVPASTSAENSALKNKSTDRVGSQSLEPSASGSSEPVGLGGGLIPKVLIALACGHSITSFHFDVGYIDKSHV